MNNDTIRIWIGITCFIAVILCFGFLVYGLFFTSSIKMMIAILVTFITIGIPSIFTLEYLIKGHVTFMGHRSK